jgi:hypothetical protein
VGKLIEERDYQDYWGASRPVLDAVQRYEKARNQLASERVDMIVDMIGGIGRGTPIMDRSKSFYSAGLDRDDEIDRMHRAWLKLRPHLAMIRGKVRWGNYREPEHYIKFDEFKLHWDFHKKLQKKCITHYGRAKAVEDPDRPEFIGGPDAF